MLPDRLGDRMTRRAFGAAAALAAVALPRESALAQDQPQAWEQAVKGILGEAKPSDGKLTIDLPEIAENGNTVPFTVSVESPMTEKDYVKTIRIIATANPQPVWRRSGSRRCTCLST